MTKKQIPSLPPQAVEGGLWCSGGKVCNAGAVCLGAAGWYPHNPIFLPLTQKLQGNCFLAAFPPPLWFIAARRLRMWRWHKSHPKEREGENLHSLPCWHIEWSFPVHCWNPEQIPGRRLRHFPQYKTGPAPGASIPARGGSHSRKEQLPHSAQLPLD